MPLDISIVTQEREVLSGEADFVLARADGGDIGILPGHSPFLAALHHARLVVHDDDGQTYVAVHGGFIEVFEDTVTVLTDVGELAEEIDIDRARREQEEAQRALREENSEENRRRVLKTSNRVQTAAEAGLLGIG